MYYLNNLKCYCELCQQPTEDDIQPLCLIKCRVDSLHVAAQKQSSRAGVQGRETAPAHTGVSRYQAENETFHTTATYMHKYQITDLYKWPWHGLSKLCCCGL